MYKTACIILPTYNEANNIGRIITKIFSQQSAVSSHILSILVVDDNSPDNTQEKVKELIPVYPNLYLITGSKTGLGEAYKRGIGHAIKCWGPDLIFQMDADGQHDPGLVPRFIEAANKGFSLVIGSRFVPGGSIPGFSIWRNFISRTGNILVRYFGGVRKIQDCTSGFRCIKTSFIESCDLTFLSASGYSFMSSFLCELINQGAVPKEIPIVFSRRDSGYSKLTLRDQIEFLINIPKLRFHNSADFIRYSLVGSSGVFVNLGVYILLTRSFDLPKELAPIVAIEMSVLSNFFLNNFWTFKKRAVKTPLISRIFKFHLVVGGSGILNYVTFFFLLKVVLLNDLLANLVGISVAAILNYLINSNWTWKKGLKLNN